MRQDYPLYRQFADDFEINVKKQTLILFVSAGTCIIYTLKTGTNLIFISSLISDQPLPSNNVIAEKQLKRIRCILARVYQSVHAELYLRVFVY